jgi:hypothetical protein
MADKKTSQETSGAPIQGADLWRIARSGSNYKLTSDEIFSETLTLANFQTLAGLGNLIPGRWYKVTGVNPYPKTVLVQAVTPNNWGTSAIWIDTVSGFYWKCTVDDLSATITSVTNDHGTTWFDFDIVTPSSLDDLWSGSEIRQSTITVNGGGAITDCHVAHSYIQLDSSNFTNCVFENCIIINTDSSSHTLTNCNFSNCTLYLTNNCVLDQLTIIGKDKGTNAYEFDQTVSNGVVVTGEFSTVVYDLDLGNPGNYDPITKKLLIPQFNRFIGVYRLKNISANTDIQFIQGIQDNYGTPIKFIHDDATNFQVMLLHQTSISSTSSYGICLASHHGSNDHLDSIGSYFYISYDVPNDVNRVSEIVNWNV